MKAYTKREPRFLREQKPGLARRVTAPRTAAAWSFSQRPRPIASGPGSAVTWRQTPATAPQPER